jgi:hypothetical protein
MEFILFSFHHIQSFFKKKKNYKTIKYSITLFSLMTAHSVALFIFPAIGAEKVNYKTRKHYHKLDFLSGNIA